MSADGQRSRPGPKPRLSRDEIADVALTILTAEEPERFSLRRVASAVGVTPRALYSYFSSKDQLESAIVERVMPRPPELPDPTVPWHLALQDFLMEIHDAFAAQPGAARLFAQRSTTDPAMDRVREYLLKLLTVGGLKTPEAVSALGALGRYLVGCVIIEQARPNESAGTETARLQTLAAEEFPTLTRVASNYSERNSVESTRYGLDLLIRGLVEATP